MDFDIMTIKAATGSKAAGMHDMKAGRGTKHGATKQIRVALEGCIRLFMAT